MNLLDTFMNALALHPLLIISAITLSVLLTSIGVIICCEPWAGEEGEPQRQAYFRVWERLARHNKRDWI